MAAESNDVLPMSQETPLINLGYLEDDEQDLGQYMEQEQLVNGNVNLLAPPRSSSPGGLSCNSCLDEPPMEKGILDVQVVTSPGHILDRQNSAATAGMPVYRMEAQPRGLALIIEIEDYGERLETRIGSQTDVTNLRNLFKQLSFKPVHHKNPGYADLRRLLREFAGDDRHLAADMAVIVILSHGNEGKIFTAEGGSFQTEDIFVEFNNANCPKLMGKPKFFIVQACRGPELDRGIEEDLESRLQLEQNGGGAAAGAPARKRRHPGSSRDTDSDPFATAFHPDGDPRARPTWEDMVIANSTIPGFASIRDHEKGTWFIQSLVEIFSHHAHEKELVDLLRMTSQRLSQFTNEFREKQTCNIEMRHLYKRIYFNPVPLGESAKGLRRTQSTPPASPKGYVHEI